MADPTPTGTPSEQEALAQVDREFRAMLARMTGGISPQDYGAAWCDWWLHYAASPAKQMALSKSAVEKAMDLWLFSTQALQGQPLSPNDPGHKDRRFAAEPWQMYPFNVYARAYQAGAGLMQEMVSGIEGVQQRNAQLMGFAMQQFAEAVSPANSPATNPEVIQQTLQEQGANLSRGWKNFVEDMERTLRGGQPAGTRELHGRRAGCRHAGQGRLPQRADRAHPVHADHARRARRAGADRAGLDHEVLHPRPVAP
jgi:polyhydroxyalkanoate synthase subunit PhaC